jgi:hypothetical protein
MNIQRTLTLLKWHHIAFGVGFGLGISRAIIEDLVPVETDEMKTSLAKANFYLNAAVKMPVLIVHSFTGLILAGGSINFFITQSIVAQSICSRTYESYKRYQAAKRKDWVTFDSYHVNSGVMKFLQSVIVSELLPQVIIALTQLLTGTLPSQGFGFDIVSI